jgi:hypothetical protein
LVSINILSSKNINSKATTDGIFIFKEEGIKKLILSYSFQGFQGIEFIHSNTTLSNMAGN